MIFSWLASLGLASKLTIGASAVAVGVAGGGAAGVLPPVAQETFDEIVAATDIDEEPVEAPVEEVPVEEVPVEEVPVEEDPVEQVPVEQVPVEQVPVEEAPVEDGDVYANHGQKVSAVARDTTLSGREHGKAVSAAAHDKSGKQATPEDDGQEDADRDEADLDVKPAKKGKDKGNR